MLCRVRLPHVYLATFRCVTTVFLGLWRFFCPFAKNIFSDLQINYVMAVFLLIRIFRVLALLKLRLLGWNSHSSAFFSVEICCAGLRLNLCVFFKIGQNIVESLLHFTQAFILFFSRLFTLATGLIFVIRR